MSSVYERLISLFSATGLNTESGTYADAEAWAYSVGAELVNERLDEIKKAVFFSLYTDGSTEYYLKMLSLNGDIAENEELIKERLSQNYGAAQMNTNLFAQAEKLGEFSFESDGDSTVALNVDSNALLNIGRFFGGAAVCSKPPALEGTGLTFRQWDSLNKSFRTLENLHLPFGCIDTLDYSLMA